MNLIFYNQSQMQLARHIVMVLHQIMTQNDRAYEIQVLTKFLIF